MTVSAITADTQDSPLLAAVVARLRDRIDGLTKANCFETDQPIPPDSYFPQGEVACTVCLIDGHFDQQLWNGGGPNQLRESPQLAVTLLRRSKIDQPPRLTAALQDSKGLLKAWKPHLLRALLVEDPAADPLVPWQPVDEDGNPILRGMGLVPIRSQGPRALGPTVDWIGLTLWFEVSFDWDLRLPEVSA